MKTTILLLLLPFLANATKIEKQGTLLNKECESLGTRCKTKPVKYAILYHEPEWNGLWIQIDESEVSRLPELEALLSNKKEISFLEPFTLSEADHLALKCESFFEAVKGPCLILLKNKKYYIKLHS